MTSSHQNIATGNQADRVRSSTSPGLNRTVDRQTDENIQQFSRLDRRAISQRIDALDLEWDVERVLEVNASTLALSGLVLGLTVSKRWFLLPGVVLPFLLQHGLQGWCPPLSILRRLGVRTRGEIDREKFALLEALEHPPLNTHH
ncbi:MULTISPECIES: hypothetical protein [Pseudomonas]|uniref:hypothetical protein n=1 Tax=Pseudomonas TaxID=286 RepID=UPI001238BA1A|nr:MULTISPECIES: hypothetical protein [Pseudomonas]QIB50039.1 hypothetical protein G3M63_02530 [Pseudomonas sp. OIL-1]